jgi:Cu(I)/Ag(I) efflux system membrane fusion protein
VKKFKNLLKNLTPVIMLLIGVGLGMIAFSFMTSNNNPSFSDIPTKTNKQTNSKNNKNWTCSMHPQVQQPKKGKCPICFMDLIPALDNLQLSKHAETIAEIEVAPVEKKFVEKHIRVTGKINYNESKLAYITARIPGRIDRLFVDYTGMMLRKGEHLAEYYSPELLVAQQELLMAVKSKNKKFIKSITEKLLLWGLTNTNVDNIIDTDKVSNTVTFYSPIGGIVIHKEAVEGKYFKTGDKLFTIVDLSTVWLELNVYESDLAWIKYGQNVEIISEANPNEAFDGTISFINPILNDKTRTVSVRVNVENPQLKLKPNMFVKASIVANIAQNGNVIPKSFSNKWICPMHHEIVKDEKKECDICGMTLEKPEKLGYKVLDNTKPPLVIPTTAPLITGKRAVVYVKSKDQKGVYNSREIKLGGKADDYYIVTEGLQEGELIVVNGVFKIDSALQLLAKPSMMSMSDDYFSKTDVKKPTKSLIISDEFKLDLDQIYINYYKIQQGLSKDNFNNAFQGIENLQIILNNINVDVLNDAAKNEFKKVRKSLLQIIDSTKNLKNITSLRIKFKTISEIMYSVSTEFSGSGKVIVRQFFCPMAFDNKGGYWLQESDETENPYYGDMMYRCGEKIEDIILEQNPK